MTRKQEQFQFFYNFGAGSAYEDREPDTCECASLYDAEGNVLASLAHRLEVLVGDPQGFKYHCLKCGKYLYRKNGVVVCPKP